MYVYTYERMITVELTFEKIYQRERMVKEHLVRERERESLLAGEIERERARAREGDGESTCVHARARTFIQNSDRGLNEPRRLPEIDTDLAKRDTDVAEIDTEGPEAPPIEIEIPNRILSEEESSCSSSSTPPPEDAARLFGANFEDEGGGVGGKLLRKAQRLNDDGCVGEVGVCWAVLKGVAMGWRL